MLASIKKSTVRVKDSVVRAKHATQRWVRRHRKKLLIIFLILLAIGLTIGLILAAYHGVEITNYGVIINYTEEKILNGTYNNQVHLIGINSIYYLVPKRKFLIYFEDSAPSKDAYWAPKLTVRSSEGTKMLVSARVSCQIRLPSALIKDFLEDYGLNWKTYVIEKSRNVITQIIGQTAFYQINNTLLLQKTNLQFSSYYQLSNYPFSFKLLSLKLQYPPNSFSATNSLGIRLLTQKSLYAQLTTNYNNLNSKILTSLQDIQDISGRIGRIQAEIGMVEMQVRGLDGAWLAGMEVLGRFYEGSSEDVRKFVWLYFQKVYNSTYNNYTFY